MSSKFNFRTIGAVGLAVLWLGLGVIPTLAQAAPLTVVLRDSYGKPLSGVECEVLSYDWGLQVGQAYAVIAKGETDANGSVTFDASLWPNSGYRFKFSPTPRLQPANTFFDPQNQYRGYPAAYVGGKTETQFFFIAADGLAYNDLAEGQGSPTFQRDPVGGLDQPRLTLMPSQNYLATVKAGTLEAQARGEPTPTLPPPPAPFKGVAEPLTITPGAAVTTPTVSTRGATTTLGLTVIPNKTSAAGSSTRNGPTSNPNSVSAVSQPTTTNLFGSVVLAIAGVVSLFLFLKYRHWLYFWLGLGRRPVAKSKKNQAKTTKAGGSVQSAKNGVEDEIKLTSSPKGQTQASTIMPGKLKEEEK